MRTNVEQVLGRLDSLDAARYEKYEERIHNLEQIVASFRQLPKAAAQTKMTKVMEESFEKLEKGVDQLIFGVNRFVYP